MAKKRKVNFDFEVEVDNSLIDGCDEGDRKIIKEAIFILNSKEIKALKNAHIKEKCLEIVINGRTILYEIDIPCEGEKPSAMALFEENGFVLCCNAFKDKMEFIKSILQELYRLYNTKIKQTGLSKEIASNETMEAFLFSNTIYDKCFK